MKRRDIIELSSPRTDKKRMRSGRDYVVGIDTGGTFTDGVLLDYHSREVITSQKILTTRENLSTGIISALEALEIDDASRIRLVGISSTLATNSIAEGRAREVALLLIGYDRDMIESYDLASKFPTKNIFYFRGGHSSQGTEKEPPDLDSIREWAEAHKDQVDALAVSSYFSPLNPAHEEQAFEAIQSVCSLPVVLGHQLSTKIDSIRRATTACLNASLVAIMQEFIKAVQTSLKDQGICAPLMIVRGDGSLMPYTVAARKPVETVLSGPAASAIGGRFLSGHNSAVVVDVGGTTTDIALIEDGRMNVSEAGARVGAVETAVKAARIRTACIGCDSRISFGKGKTIEVGPDRVVPLSRLADRFPAVAADIRALKQKRRRDWLPTDLEYWILYKAPDAATSRNPLHADLIRLLEKEPLSLTEILSALKLHHAVQLNADALIGQGYIERATLTPTDLLHVSGQISLWDGDAARIAVARACEMYGRDSDAFAEETLTRIVHMMAEEVFVFLAGHDTEAHLPETLNDQWGRWFFRQAVRDGNPFLSMNIASRLPMIGIGGPAGYFVRRVAKALNAPFVLPPSAEVANAVGAVAGSVSVEREALIFMKETDTGTGFMVQIDGEPPRFMEEENEAASYAEKVVATLAGAGASEAGAVSPQIIVEQRIDGSVRRVMARAIGNPELSGGGTEHIHSASA
ncbi:hypothetical protein DENIS_2367 [Desulfonema ishimotonii]|uniref:Hydantoinase/oxoprolinase family protein n=1 Tax=Desulfonema ishimotonii TaxID=45657 RepID=A0A401FWQ7_9BACT|nr:hydantoinase/oxoprolinase family protein [Desulfonema ishimotonii]GBC61407.1 hypothetical protein DENIS_2367 [Desulfonema ishimotonii]